MHLPKQAKEGISCMNLIRPSATQTRDRLAISDDSSMVRRYLVPAYQIYQIYQSAILVSPSLLYVRTPIRQAADLLLLRPCWRLSAQCELPITDEMAYK